MRSPLCLNLGESVIDIDGILYVSLSTLSTSWEKVSNPLRIPQGDEDSINDTLSLTFREYSSFMDNWGYFSHSPLLLMMIFSKTPTGSTCSFVYPIGALP